MGFFGGARIVNEDERPEADFEVNIQDQAKRAVRKSDHRPRWIHPEDLNHRDDNIRRKEVLLMLIHFGEGFSRTDGLGRIRVIDERIVVIDGAGDSD